MEERMKNYRQLGPERAKVWTEKIPKYQQQQPQQTDGKVPVVYYLCRNQQLDHPHFMEVPMSSHDGLYLRGTGMASSYSFLARVKDQTFGLIHTYKPRLSFKKLDCLTRNKRLMSLSFEDEEYFCASWTESINTKEKQQSSFFPSKRTNRQPRDSAKIKEGPSSRCSKYTQQSINASLDNLPKK